MQYTTSRRLFLTSLVALSLQFGASSFAQADELDDIVKAVEILRDGDIPSIYGNFIIGGPHM